MSSHTHTGWKESVSYEHRGSLYGHSEATPGVTHAMNYLDTVRWIGTRYRTLCGKVCGAAHRVFAAGKYPVTCAKCLRAVQK